MEKVTDVNSFLAEIAKIITSQTSFGNHIEALPVSFYRTLIAEIQCALTFPAITSFTESDDKGNVQKWKLCMHDEAGRVHEMVLFFPAQYPSQAPRVDIVAPLPLCIEWKLGYSFQNVVKQIEIFLKKFQRFWTLMEDIDANTWIIEPAYPNKSHIRRRIAIGIHASIEIEIDPEQPSDVLEILFYGKADDINPLQEKWENGKRNWNHSLTIRENIQHIGKFTFPCPSTIEKESFTLECGICYSYRLFEYGDGEETGQEECGAIPDRICDNEKCARPYHNGCLLEWLRSLPNAHRSFNTLFGTCVYCQEAISAKTT